MVGSAFALTDDDLIPAALAGETLIFTIEPGPDSLATPGVWTGTFDFSPSNGFADSEISGATVNSNGTWTCNGYIGGHAHTINPFITGSNDDLLENGIGKKNSATSRRANSAQPENTPSKTTAVPYSRTSPSPLMAGTSQTSSSAP